MTIKVIIAVDGSHDKETLIKITEEDKTVEISTLKAGTFKEAYIWAGRNIILSERDIDDGTDKVE